MDDFKVKTFTVDDIKAKPYWEALVDAKNAEQVDAVFDRLKALGAEDCKHITGTIERDLVDETIEVAKEEKETCNTSYELEEGVDPAEAAALVQGMFRQFALIAEIRGAAADPLTKAFARAAKKLSPDERRSFEALMTTTVKAYDTVFPPKPDAPKSPRI